MLRKIISALCLGLFWSASAMAATINVGGSCTLVNAITAANTDTATGGCSGGAGADEIVLPTGSTQTLTSINNDFDGVTGLPAITSNIFIDGNKSTITRTPNAANFRIFAVDANGSLKLLNVTISNGNTFPDGSQGFGGFPRGGGGVYNRQGVVDINNSTLVDNFGTFNGGGILNFGIMTITNSTLSHNGAEDGGGIFNQGTMAVNNATIVGNTKINPANPVQGNGIFNGGSLTLNQTLVSGNTTFRGESSPEVFNAAQATIVTDNFNLFGYNGVAGVEGFAPGASDIVPNVPQSDIFIPTLILPATLPARSPAVDAIPVNECVSGTDQRGVIRPQDGNRDGIANCDIGSFELEPQPAGPGDCEQVNEDGDCLGPPADIQPTSARPQLPCVGSNCKIILTCTLAQGVCTDSVTVVIPPPQPLRARAVTRALRFCAAVANIPAGQSQQIKLKLTKKGKAFAAVNRGKRVRGIMQITNSAETTFSSIRVKLKLK